MSDSGASSNTGSSNTGSSSEASSAAGASAIGLWHRILVDRIAESRWLRGRSGKGAAWLHYERHARASNAATLRHARARARARLAADHGSPRILRGWQAAIGRLTERQGK